MSLATNGIVINPSETAPRIAWHPKLTGYRLSMIVVTTCFGTSKAILTYLQKSIVSTTFEWLLTVVLGLL
jgi:hypothetical protein